MKLKAIVKRILFISDTLSTVPLHLTLGMQSVVFLTTWPDNQYCVLRAVLEKGDEMFLRFLFLAAKPITEGSHHSLGVHRIE